MTDWKFKYRYQNLQWQSDIARTLQSTCSDKHLKSTQSTPRYVNILA